jgi:hypothetical protein
VPADSRPRPMPPAGRTAAPRPQATRINGIDVQRPDQPRQAMHPDQYIRLQALRTAVERYRNKPDVPDDELLATAARFAGFIFTRPPAHEKEDHDRHDLA